MKFLAIVCQYNATQTAVVLHNEITSARVVAAMTPHLLTSTVTSCEGHRETTHERSNYGTTQMEVL